VRSVAAAPARVAEPDAWLHVPSAAAATRLRPLRAVRGTGGATLVACPRARSRATAASSSVAYTAVPSQLSSSSS
jgi:hypothetical protein